MSKFFYTPLIKQALKICFEAHKDQVDKDGIPYIYHPFHLAEQMDTEEEICAALLHDVVEDTGITLNQLREIFPPAVTDAVELLTHREDLCYLEYVRKLKPNPIARKVKLADLTHNSDQNRISTVTEQDLLRWEKYRKAREILLEEEEEVR